MTGPPSPSTDERLRDEACIWLCTLRPDGSPHTTPIWHVWTGGRLWVCTTDTAVKARNLRGDPRAAATLADPMKPVVVEGRAIVHGRPFPPEITAEFVRKFDWDIAGDADGYTVLVEIVPERWLMGGAPTATS